MKHRIAACVALLCLPLGSSPLFGDGDQQSQVKFTDELILRKARLQQNAEFSVKEYVVEVGPAAVSEVRNVLNENALQSRPIGSSAAAAQAGNDAIIARALEAAKTPIPEPALWNIKFYNGMSKFTESCDEPALPAKPGVEMMSDNGNQYLVTNAAMYEYQPSRSVLSVKPLDPTTDAYPVRLDDLSLEFNLIGSGAHAFNGMPLVHAGASYRAERPGNSQLYLFRASKEGLISQYFFIQGRHGSFVEKTFANYFELTDKTPLAVPSLGASVAVSSNGTGVLEILAVTQASLGKLTAADLPIAVSKDTNINDSPAMDPALIIHPPR